MEDDDFPVCDDVDYTIQHIPRQSPERMLRLLLLLPWMPLKDVWNKDMLFWHGRTYSYVGGIHIILQLEENWITTWAAPRKPITEADIEMKEQQQKVDQARTDYWHLPRRWTFFRKRLKEHDDLILSGDWLLIVILLPGSEHSGWRRCLLDFYLFHVWKINHHQGVGGSSSSSRWLLKKRRNQQQKSSFTDWWVECVCAQSQVSCAWFNAIVLDTGDAIWGWYRGGYLVRVVKGRKQRSSRMTGGQEDWGMAAVCTSVAIRRAG